MYGWKKMDEQSQVLEYKLKTLEKGKGYIRVIIKQNIRKIESISFVKASKILL